MIDYDNFGSPGAVVDLILVLAIWLRSAPALGPQPFGPQPIGHVVQLKELHSSFLTLKTKTTKTLCHPPVGPGPPIDRPSLGNNVKTQLGKGQIAAVVKSPAPVTVRESRMTIAIEVHELGPGAKRINVRAIKA